MLAEAVTVEYSSKATSTTNKTVYKVPESHKVLCQDSLLESSDDSVYEIDNASSQDSFESSDTSISKSYSKSCLTYLSSESSSFHSNLDEWEKEDMEITDQSESDSVDESMKNKKLEVTNIMNDFYEYLTSADSGNRDQKTAKTCCQRVSKILQVVSSNLNMHDLVNRNLLRDVFLKDYCPNQNYYPKTIQSYLNSLEHFLNYVISENLNNILDLKHAERLKCTLVLWKSSFVKASRVATMQKMETERRTKITPDDILEFEASKVVRDTIKCTGFLSEGRKVKISQSIFSNVRDLLITEIFIDNGHRAGVLANMTLEEYENCEKLTSNDVEYCITVYKHKEARAGPIRVMLSSKLHSWFQIYVKYCRVAVTKDMSPNAKVFLTWNGGTFEYSGGISQASNAIWKKAGMRKHCGANRFRKAAVSATRSSDLADNQTHQDLASLMGHQKATADRYYYMEEKMHSAQQAASKLPIIMRTAKVSNCEVKNAENSKDSGSSCSSSAALEQDKASFNKEFVNNPDQANYAYFLPADVKNIKDVFSAEISSKKFSFSDVRKKWIKHPILGHLQCKQVYDKLRHLCSQSLLANKESSSLPVLPSMTASEKVATMEASNKNQNSDDDCFISGSIGNTSSRASRKIHSKDVQRVVKIFESLIRSKTAKLSDINAIMKSNCVAKKLVHTYSLSTIQNRIKYEIRKSKL